MREFLAVAFGKENVEANVAWLEFALGSGKRKSLRDYFLKDFYNDHVMRADTGPYAALVAYESELLRVRETLKQMEDEYRRTEGDNAELWGRA